MSILGKSPESFWLRGMSWILPMTALASDGGRSSFTATRILSAAPGKKGSSTMPRKRSASASVTSTRFSSPTLAVSLASAHGCEAST